MVIWIISISGSRESFLAKKKLLMLKHNLINN